MNKRCSFHCLLLRSTFFSFLEFVDRKTVLSFIITVPRIHTVYIARARPIYIFFAFALCALLAGFWKIRTKFVY